MRLARQVLGPRASFTVAGPREPGARLAGADDADHRPARARAHACAVRGAVSPAGGASSGSAAPVTARVERLLDAARAAGRAAIWRPSSRRRLRSASPGTCSGCRSTTCPASAGSTTPSPGAWCTTVIPSRNGGPTPPGQSSVQLLLGELARVRGAPRCLGHLRGGVRPRDRARRRRRSSPSCG